MVKEVTLKRQEAAKETDKNRRLCMKTIQMWKIEEIMFHSVFWKLKEKTCKLEIIPVQMVIQANMTNSQLKIVKCSALFN